MDFYKLCNLTLVAVVGKVAKMMINGVGMKSLKRFALVGLLVLTVFQGALANGPKAPLKNLSSYVPASRCTDSQARKVLEDISLAYRNNPFGDGYGSWPLLTGIWANMDRNVYLGVTIRHFNRSKSNYHVQIAMYSLCSRELLATGAAYYSVQRDSFPKAIQLQLVNASPDLKISRLRLTVVTPADKTGDLRIRFEGFNATKTFLIDDFLLYRPEKLIPGLKN